MFTGKVFKYGDDVNTDVIIPARYLNSADNDNLRAHCMEDIDEHFASSVKEGDIVVGGFNFGCGSSREHAPLALKASGIRLTIAKSFARIFYRNSINIGLPVVEDEDLANDLENGDLLEADLNEGWIKNLTTGRMYAVSPLPEFLQDIVQKGGLMSTVNDEDIL